ncbi:hypothetical protein FRC04_007350, partial [Tulasnella sp. 424]
MPGLLQPLMHTSNSPTNHQRTKFRGKEELRASLLQHLLPHRRQPKLKFQIPSSYSVFLLGLPSLLLHPPDHPNHVPSLCASLDALSKCLSLHSSLGGNGSGALSFEQGMQAYGMQAEIGLKFVSDGLGGYEGPEWARGIESE